MSFWSNPGKSLKLSDPTRAAPTSLAGDAFKHWWLANRGNFGGVGTLQEIGEKGLGNAAEDKARNAYAANWNITQASPGIGGTTALARDQWGVNMRPWTGALANTAGGVWGPVAGAAAGWGLNSQFGEESDYKKASRETAQGAGSGVLRNVMAGKSALSPGVGAGTGHAASALSAGNLAGGGATVNTTQPAVHSAYSVPESEWGGYGPQYDSAPATYGPTVEASEGPESMPSGGFQYNANSGGGTQPNWWDRTSQAITSHTPSPSTMQSAYPWAQMGLNYYLSTQQQHAMQPQVQANNAAIEAYRNMLENPRDFYASNPALAQQRQNRLNTLEAQQLAKTGGVRGGAYGRQLMQESSAFDQQAYQQALQSQLALVGATNPMMQAYLQSGGSTGGAAANSASNALSDWQFQQLLQHLTTQRTVAEGA